MFVNWTYFLHLCAVSYFFVSEPYKLLPIQGLSWQLYNIGGIYGISLDGKYLLKSLAGTRCPSRLRRHAQPLNASKGATRITKICDSNTRNWIYATLPSCFVWCTSVHNFPLTSNQSRSATSNQNGESNPFWGCQIVRPVVPIQLLVHVYVVDCIAESLPPPAPLSRFRFIISALYYLIIREHHILPPLLQV